jgi:hypothetical protein
MPYSVVEKPSKYFNTATYAGAGTSTQSVTGVGFAPDLIWIKNRTDAYSHVLQDVCRGFGATKNLASNSTSAEGASGATGDNYGHVSTSDSDGFTVTHTINGSNDGGTIRKGTHFSGNNYVSWNWLANGTGVSNTSGSISSTVSANTTSGFSVVSYTGNATAGATVGHGLGAVPKMIIIKPRTITENWATYHASLGNANNVTLNTSNASGATSDYNSTSPTSTVFSLGSGSGTNGNGNTIIAYCFAEVKGYSKFGSYTGNGSTDGTFVYTGFKPAMIIAKQSSGGQAWQIHDTARDTFNLATRVLFPNSSSAEQNSSANGALDILSNGFKWRMADADQNGSGSTYIYMAFASNPFVSSKGIPTTAR